MQKPVYILGIESSCDETAASICVDGAILSNVIATQDIHKKYGGVVPELASRAHQENIVPVVETALQHAGVNKTQLSAVAFTQGPGLLGPLLVGVSFSKGLSLALDIPLIAVNHMEAHILAHFIDNPKPSFPLLNLTVSGGHTQLVLLNDYFDLKVLGQTIDDAAGEAFDKAAKMLGFEYPGGPLIDKYAQLGKPIFTFTEPNIPKLNFSFSGFKTALMYFLREQTKVNPNFVDQNINDICASVQARIVSILINKLKKAQKQTGVKNIAISGGVSANSGLRTALLQYGQSNQLQVFIPKFEHCTDNAAMIAITGYLKYQRQLFVNQDIIPEPRLKLQ